MGNRSNINLVGNTTFGENVGTGTGVYKGKNLGNVLQLKTLSVTGTTMSITTDADNIYFSAATGGGGGGLTASNNGLCDNGTTVGLGGTLANDTTIYGDTYSNQFNLNSVASFNVTGATVDMKTDAVQLCGCGTTCVMIGPSDIVFNTNDFGNVIHCVQNASSCHVFCKGNIRMCALPTKSSETNVLYINSAGQLSSGATSGGGGIAVSGVTDTSVTTYINASGDLCAQPNLKFNGTTLAIAANMAFCSGADRYITISNTTSAPSRHLLICAQQYHGFETSGDVSGGRVCLCGGFGNNTSESGGSGTGGDAHIFGGTGKIHTGSATGGDVLICGGWGWVTTSGTGTGGTVHLCGGDGDTIGRIRLSGLPSKVSETCVVWIDASGNLSTATPASDSRLKCCVTPISSATSMLSGICGYSAEFNNLSNCEGCCEYVFLAQEVEKELPLAVKNGVIINEVDYKKIEYDQLIPVMWNIIKEQEARIQALESK